MAFFVFPIIAILFTIPYIIREYRKYGSILFLKTLIVYSFILYIITCYFLVILPLPTTEEANKLNTPIMQLIPFHCIYDFIKESGFVVARINTYLPAILHSSFYNILFNILLFIPFGIYVRYYFKQKFRKCILYSFLLSLFFELTQLSGLYGIYQRPYRLFDVDDLMTNTLGGFIGYVITPLIYFILPTRERLDQESMKKGYKVSYFRRFIALIIDFITIYLLYLFSQFHISYTIVYICYFLFIPFMSNGYTLGQWTVKIKIISQNQTPLKFYQILIRNGILYLLLIPSPFIITHFLSIILDHSLFMLLPILFVLFLGTWIYFFHILICILSKKTILFYERYSHTQLKSVIYSVLS